MKNDCQKSKKSFQTAAEIKTELDSELKSIRPDNLNKAKELKEEISLSVEFLWKKLPVMEKVAEKIFGEDFCGSKAVEKVFGRKFAPKELPKIKFSLAELMLAKELGQVMILRIDKDGDGKDITMDNINKRLQSYIDLHTGTPFEVKKGPFYTSETPRLSWALISNGIVPESTFKTRFEQIETLMDFVEDKIIMAGVGGEYVLYGEDEVEAREDFRQNEKRIRGIPLAAGLTLQEAVWNLEANDLLMHTPIELIYDLFLYFKNTGKKLLKSHEACVKVSGNESHFAGIGDIDLNEKINFHLTNPNAAYMELGVMLSRKR